MFFLSIIKFRLRKKPPFKQETASTLPIRQKMCNKIRQLTFPKYEQAPKLKEQFKMNIL